MEPTVQSDAPISNDLNALFFAYGDMVYRLALVRTRNPSDAEDISQEVFLRCFQSAPKFLTAEHQKAWLIRVTINCSKTLAGSAYRRHTVPLDAAGEPMVPDGMPDSTVYDAVLRLPPKFRTAIHLFYYEDYSVREIAAAMRASESAVKSWLFRARALLKDDLKGDFDDVS